MARSVANGVANDKEAIRPRAWQMEWQLYDQEFGKGMASMWPGVWQKWNDSKWPGVWQRLYGSYGQERDKWEGSHVAMNVATNGMANA